MLYLEHVAFLHALLLDGIGFRIFLVVSVLGIGVDGAVVVVVGFEEVELYDARVSVFVAFSADIPAVHVWIGRLSCHGDVACGLGFEIDALFPVARHAADELEGVGIFLVVFGQVGCHLEWAVHRQIECELADECGVYEVRVVAPRFELRFEYAGRVVHRSALQSCKGQNEGVVGAAASECLVFRAARTFVSDEVGIGAAKSGGSHSLVGIHHDVVLGGLFHHILVMVHHGLREVVVATWDDVAHIARLHRVVAVSVHQIECIVEMSLIVHDAR